MAAYQSIEELAAQVLATTPGLREISSNLRPVLDKSLKQRAIVVVPQPAGGDVLESGMGLDARSPGLSPMTRQRLEDGGRVLAAFGRQPLTGEDAENLEAVVLLVGRPALLIQSDDFAPAPEPWERLDEERESIRKNVKSVGRIEVVIDGTTMMIGTGFMAASEVIMTNRHVADAFVERRNGALRFPEGMTPQIDFRRESGSTARSVFAIDSVIDIHTDPLIDLALLKIGTLIEGSPGAQVPPPLSLASEPPQDQPEVDPRRTIYVIGYPATDNAGTTPVTVLREIFGSTVRVKRLAPGFVMRLTEQGRQFEHDCSTLGGNSGSCVIDMAMDQVVGLHFAGVFRTANNAVALWKLPEDAMVRNAGLNFD